MKKFSVVGIVLSVALAAGYAAKVPQAVAEASEGAPEQLKFCADCGALQSCKTTTIGYYGCTYDNHECTTSGGECVVGF